MLPKKLQNKLNKRHQDNAFRQLVTPNNLVDFSSNDYLGFAASQTIFNQTHQYLKDNNYNQNGSTGSRLLSGNHTLNEDVEHKLIEHHKSESALVFNSGYTANIGFFSSVPQRNDIILYDEYCHASIRDGIEMSNAKGYKFRHNDLAHLGEMLNKIQHDAIIYIVTESVFSMDGDSPDMKTMSQLCKTYNANLIIDEAHSVGIFGTNGNGLINQYHLEKDIFARIVTFGKALGCHGAAILGTNDLRDYLINFSRPFIYTTALSPHSLATIKITYDELVSQSDNKESPITQLRHNIAFFKSEIKRLKYNNLFIDSDSAIQSCIIYGNEKVKHISEELKNNGFNVKPILSPTVPKEKERLRFCIHSYNSEEEITKVLEGLATFV